MNFYLYPENLLTFAGFSLLFAFLMAILLGVIVRFSVKSYLGKGVQMVQYEAPRLFTPAEIGWLYDRQIGEKELAATVLSLVYQKILHAEVRRGRLYVQYKPADRYESEIDGIEGAVLAAAKEAAGELSLDNLVQKTYRDWPQLPTVIVRQLVQRDVIAASDVGFFGMYKRRGAVIGTTLIITIFYFALVRSFRDNGLNPDYAFLARTLLLILFFPIFILVAFVLWASILWVFRAVSATPVRFRQDNNQQWRDIHGYGDYLRQVQSDNFAADFEDALKNRDFAYAVALGINKL